MNEENSGLKVFWGSAVPVQPADVRLLPVFFQNQIYYYSHSCDSFEHFEHNTVK